MPQLVGALLQRGERDRRGVGSSLGLALAVEGDLRRRLLLDAPEGRLPLANGSLSPSSSRLPGAGRVELLLQLTRCSHARQPLAGLGDGALDGARLHRRRLGRVGGDPNRARRLPLGGPGCADQAVVMTVSWGQGGHRVLAHRARLAHHEGGGERSGRSPLLLPGERCCGLLQSSPRGRRNLLLLVGQPSRLDGALAELAELGVGSEERLDLGRGGLITARRLALVSLLAGRANASLGRRQLAAHPLGRLPGGGELLDRRRRLGAGLHHASGQAGLLVVPLEQQLAPLHRWSGRPGGVGRPTAGSGQVQRLAGCPVRRLGAGEPVSQLGHLRRLRECIQPVDLLLHHASPPVRLHPGLVGGLRLGGRLGDERSCRPQRVQPGAEGVSTSSDTSPASTTCRSSARASLRWAAARWRAAWATRL
jgi:hypothetical protein